MSQLIHESHSIVPPDPKLDLVQKLGLLTLGAGLAMLTGALLKFYKADTVMEMLITLGFVFAGGLTYGIRTHLRHKPGIHNHGITRSSIASRGALGWTVGIVITTFYVVYHVDPNRMEGVTRMFDPLSIWIRGYKEKDGVIQPVKADQWFVYGTFYTIGVIIMGVKALFKYRHSRYQLARTSTIIVAQLFFAYTIPYLMFRLQNIEYYPTYFWPLQWKVLWPGEEVSKLYERKAEVIAMAMLGWSMIASFIATPILTYYIGKRWYCSWVCGCGGLANTAGDSWRQLSNKTVKAWKLERYSIYAVLLLITFTTAFLWLYHYTSVKEMALAQHLATPAIYVSKFYSFMIGAVMAGIVGTGFYPLLGTRVWCRFACPMAGILGIVQKFKSRFRITTNGGQCISCGNCSTYCEMGIDVRWYAQRGQDIKRASCVGCGMCSAVCPRGVLQLENGPTATRVDYQMDLLSSAKARKLEDKVK